MIEINVKQIKNGYTYKIDGSVRDNGEYVCKNTDEFAMFEKLIEVTLGYKVKIERR